VGLTRKLKRTPDFQIKRAILAMQFKTAQERLQRMQRAPGLPIEQLRQRVAQEYETFMATVAEWTSVKEQWYADKKRELKEKWDQTALQQRLKEIENRLKLQHRRMRLLQAQLA
jgi:stearoyl-CoA desaturase (delta-9 desaturase)